MELVQNIWTRYGFRDNPFDTAALSATAGDLLPIAKAIVGRGMDSPESKMLLGMLRPSSCYPKIGRFKKNPLRLAKIYV